jgi:hypothetical protein
VEGVIMTEAEWLACTDPNLMLKYLRGKGSDRKFRLFACACCRRAWSLLRDDRSREAIKVAERFAANQASEEELHMAQEAGLAAQWARWGGGTRRAARSQAEADQAAIEMEAALAVWRTCKARRADANADTIAHACLRPAAYAVGKGEVGDIESELAVQAFVLRDCFGNLFRPVALVPAWLAWIDGTVPKLAQAAYDERALPSGHLDLSRLAVLADALEEAGCTDPEVLAHLRGSGPHVRGCWVIDLVLGKC